ncbi:MULTISPECIES: uracil-DNA glycosylase [unclassified Streptomyces]|uniref:uracil-DNA glycosylase n=1 Tax=unclassified Streptomyces TaxID=2593676 RepID=UPI00081D7461|nr:MULTISPECIES: uracil-DNA glycosylase [unclassified Streptomyces]SCF94891.1 Uracil DNA glycosylase superfamily protein [Streptomyces sp. MnatMP-M17]
MKAIDTDRFWELLHALPVPDDAESLHGPDEYGRLRDRNLRHYLELMADIRPTVLLVGEAPGYRGHTISGVPFMSMRQLTARPGLITGAPEGDGFELPVAPAYTWEASSAAVWSALADWQGPLPISWPVYPNHPHEPGRPESNRTPRAAEIADGVPIVLALAEAFSITTVIAVGRKSQYALARNGVTAAAVRHPAQGGARIFATQLAALNRG